MFYFDVESWGYSFHYKDLHNWNTNHSLIMPPELSTVSVFPVLDLLGCLLLSSYGFTGFFFCYSRFLVFMSESLTGLITIHFRETFLVSFGASLGRSGLLTESADWDAELLVLEGRLVDVVLHLLQNDTNLLLVIFTLLDDGFWIFLAFPLLLLWINSADYFTVFFLISKIDSFQLCLNLVNGGRHLK